MERNKRLNKIALFLFLFLLVGTLLLALIFTDGIFTGKVVCPGGICSIGVSLNVLGSPPGFFSGFVQDFIGDVINSSNVSILENGFSSLTVNGVYNITDVPEGTYSLKASKSGYLSQTKTNQLIISGETTQGNFMLAQTGNLTGKVSNFFTSIGINNSNVSLFLFGGFLDSTLTNETGYYEFNDLAPGYYEINVTATGFDSVSDPDIHVLGGQTASADFWLFL